VVEADSRSVKEKPADKGGMKVEGANEAILSGTTEGKPNLAPAPEAPALGALHSNSPPAPLSVITTPPTSTGTVQNGVRVATLGETPRQAQFSATHPVDEPYPNGKPPAAVAPVDKPQAPQLASNAVPAPAKQTPSVTAPASPAVSALEPPAVSTAKPAKATKLAAVPVEHAGGKSPLVQLAALPTQAAANAEWAKLSKRYATQLSGYSPVVTSVERDGKTLWRLRVSGFADVNAAKDVCANLKAAGGQCIVVPKG
jgi:hypothetical protein